MNASAVRMLNDAPIFAVDANLGAAIAALIATVVVTMSVISWIDRRIDDKMRPLKDEVHEIHELMQEKRRGEKNHREPR